jgi:hypothetical protein
MDLPYSKEEIERSFQLLERVVRMAHDWHYFSDLSDEEEAGWRIILRKFEEMGARLDLPWLLYEHLTPTPKFFTQPLFIELNSGDYEKICANLLPDIRFKDVYCGPLVYRHDLSPMINIIDSLQSGEVRDDLIKRMEMMNEIRPI